MAKVWKWCAALVYWHDWSVRICRKCQYLVSSVGIHQVLSESARLYQSRQRSGGIGEVLSDCTSFCPNLPCRYCRNLPGFARIYQVLFEASSLCPKLPGSTRNCQVLQETARFYTETARFCLSSFSVRDWLFFCWILLYAHILFSVDSFKLLISGKYGLDITFDMSETVHLDWWMKNVPYKCLKNLNNNYIYSVVFRIQIGIVWLYGGRLALSIAR